jgi:hypothetical protein
MSAIEHTDPDDGVALDELPEFELTWLYDDDERPREVTVFLDAAGDEAVTNWITIDKAHAVSLDAVR